MEKIAKITDLKEKINISVNGKSLALFKIKGKVYCIDNKCSHVGGPLSKGKVNGTVVTCPWHGSEFDIKNGKVKRGPAVKDVKSYKVTVKDDDIFADL